MEQAEPITDYLKRRLRDAGASKFEEIAEQAGVTVSFIRKFVYGSRENPRVQTIQPLLDYFGASDETASPDKSKPTTHAKANSKPAKHRRDGPSNPPDGKPSNRRGK